MRQRTTRTGKNRNTATSRPRDTARSFVGLLLVGIVSAGTLAACGSTTDGSSSQADAPTSTVTSGSPAASTDPSDAASDDASPGAAADDPSSAATSDAPGDFCAADDLKGTLSDGDGGAAGSTLPYIVLQNTGSDACKLQGWPGVSLVGGGDGTQIGAAATQDRSSPHPTVTLIPNAHAHAPLRVAQAANYSTSKCRPQEADGLRVYVPGEKDSIFIKASGLTGCTDKDVELLEVQAVQPGIG